MPKFDYQCRTLNCHQYSNPVEKLVKKYDDVVTCTACDDPMKKMICAPSLGGMDSSGSSTGKDKNIARLL